MSKQIYRPMVDVDAIMQDKRLTERLIRVLLALYKYADASGECYPTRAQLAKCCGYDEGAIRRATAELQVLGWLTKAGGGGRGRHVRYTIHPPKKGVESTPLPETKKGGQNLPPKKGAESTPFSMPPIVVKHTNASLLHEKQTDHRAREARPTPKQEQQVIEQNFTLTSEAPRKARKASTPVERPHDVTVGTWDDWCAHRRRKRATITEGVIETARELAEEWGWTLEKYLKAWVLHGTQGFHPSWVERKQNGGGYKSAMERNAEEAKKWLYPKKQTQSADIIDTQASMHREPLQLLEKTQ